MRVFLLSLFIYKISKNMENTFTKTFITNLLAKTLFKKEYLKKNDYSFNKDFIREHKLYLSDKTDMNHWLSLEFVNTMFDLNEGLHLVVHIGYKNLYTISSSLNGLAYCL